MWLYGDHALAYHPNHRHQTCGYTGTMPLPTTQTTGIRHVAIRGPCPCLPPKPQASDMWLYGDHALAYHQNHRHQTCGYTGTMPLPTTQTTGIRHVAMRGPCPCLPPKPQASDMWLYGDHALAYHPNHRHQTCGYTGTMPLPTTQTTGIRHVAILGPCPCLPPKPQASDMWLYGDHALAYHPNHRHQTCGYTGTMPLPTTKTTGIRHVAIRGPCPCLPPKPQASDMWLYGDHALAYHQNHRHQTCGYTGTMPLPTTQTTGIRHVAIRGPCPCLPPKPQASDMWLYGDHALAYHQNHRHQTCGYTGTMPLPTTQTTGIRHVAMRGPCPCLPPKPQASDMWLYGDHALAYHPNHRHQTCGYTGTMPLPTTQTTGIRHVAILGPCPCLPPKPQASDMWLYGDHALAYHPNHRHQTCGYTGTMPLPTTQTTGIRHVAIRGASVSITIITQRGVEDRERSVGVHPCRVC